MDDHAPLRDGRRVVGACLRPKAEPLRHLRTLAGVAGRGHGVVGLQPEELAVSLRRELVRGIEMAPKDLLALAADRAAARGYDLAVLSELLPAAEAGLAEALRGDTSRPD